MGTSALNERGVSSNFRANAVPYDVIVWMTEESAKFLLIPLSVRVAQLFKKRAWVRVLFQIHSVARGGLTNFPIEDAPYSLYHSALALDVSHFLTEVDIVKSVAPAVRTVMTFSCAWVQ